MSTLTQFLGSKPKVEVFNSTGTFTVPTGVQTVFVTISGGGAGAPSYFSSGPGSGAYFKDYPVSVTPGASITVTIGAGGSGVTETPSSNSAPTAGSDSSFGPSLTATGGGAAALVPFVRANLNNRGARNGLILSNNVIVQGGGEGGLNGKGAFNPSGPEITVFGGAGGYFGNGGNAAFAPNSTTGGSAAANSGAGGGSAYAPPTAPATVTTGNGGSGRCVVVYYA